MALYDVMLLANRERVDQWDSNSSLGIGKRGKKDSEYDYL